MAVEMHHFMPYIVCNRWNGKRCGNRILYVISNISVLECNEVKVLDRTVKKAGPEFLLLFLSFY